MIALALYAAGGFVAACIVALRGEAAHTRQPVAIVPGATRLSMTLDEREYMRRAWRARAEQRASEGEPGPLHILDPFEVARLASLRERIGLGAYKGDIAADLDLRYAEYARYLRDTGRIGEETEQTGGADDGQGQDVLEASPDESH